MKRILVLFLLTIFFKVQGAQYPSLTEVINRFYSNYSVPEMKRGEQIQYQRKKDGWHVALAVYNDTASKYQIRKSELFWASATEKYKLLTIFTEGVTRYKESRIRSDISDVNLYDYERCSYFGYDGWDRDVITDFATYDGTNDTIYESLARAYSNYAQGFTNHHFSFHADIPANLSEKAKQDLFLENERKSIAVYDKLRKRNPNFEVLVGTVYTKYCNEIMSTYDDLLYMGREKEIAEYFREELYDPFMRSVAMNMLVSAERNGIIFTNGDNDSYPLWYLQWIKGVRKDVAVMNLSLMSTDYYLKRFREGFLDAPPVLFSVADSLYTGEDYFLRGEGNYDSEMSSSQFFAGMKVNVDGVNRKQYFPAGRIVVHCPESMYKNYNLLSAADSAIIEVKNYYLIQGSFALIDVVLSNFATRPVYMSSGASVPHYFRKYMYVEGMLLRFIPAEEKINECTLSSSGPVASVNLLKKNLMNLISSDSACIDQVNKRRWLSGLKLTTIYCAEMMLAQNDKSGAVALLDALYKFTGTSENSLRTFDVYALEVYYEGDAKAKGDDFGSKLIDQFERDLKSIEKKDKLTEDDKDDRSRIKSALKFAKESFDKYESPALSARCQKLLDWY
jgi:hypothetical protein